jgi:transposase
MAAALLPDPLWDLVEPFLPTPPRRPKGGRPRVSDRACLTGIVFVLRSGVPWQMLPQELGCGSGMTCWRRLRDWQQAGVWDLIHFALLDWLARDGQIDWSRAVVDSCSTRAVYGGDQTGPNPADRANRGSKRHLLCDGRGVPLAVRLTGANRNDSQEALALVGAIPPLQGARSMFFCRNRVMRLLGAQGDRRWTTANATPCFITYPPAISKSLFGRCWSAQLIAFTSVRSQSRQAPTGATRVMPRPLLRGAESCHLNAPILGARSTGHHCAGNTPCVRSACQKSSCSW